MNSNQSITVVIAEDEPLILNNIAKKVQNSADYLEVIGKVPNGLKVLELFKTQIPDILITDIEMPGMNGLELIEQVTSHYPSVRIVILSGYNNFEYARTAIRYGVKNYLLKPISQSALSEALLKVTDEILNQKQSRERNILSMTLSGNEDRSMPSQHFGNSNFILALITLGNLPSTYSQPQYSEDFLKLWDQIHFEAFLSHNNNFQRFWIIDESYLLQKFIIMHTNTEQLHTEYVSLSLYNYLCGCLDNTPFHIVINDSAIPYTDIWTVAKQLRHSTLHTLTMCTQSHTLLSSPAQNFTWNVKEQHNKINFLYQINTFHQLLKYVNETLKYYINQNIPQHYLDQFIYETYQILPLLFSFEKNTCQLAMNSVLSQLQYYQNAEVLYSMVENSLKDLYRNYASETTADSLYEKIRLYIDNNYTQKITSEDLSKRYGYTPSYINRIFKKDGNTSPLQYVTTLRIERAKELLKQEVDIKNVALAVGYDDARYFSRVFKNETGMSPSTWAAANSDVQ